MIKTTRIATMFSFAALIAAATLASAQRLALDEIVQSDSQPTGIHHAGDGSDRLFFLSKAGRVLVSDGGVILPQAFLDLTALVNSGGVERGLHGLAFHPDYAQNGFLYVMYTNLQSDSTLARYEVSSDANIADPGSATILFVVDQPDQFHNISQLQFGPDGYLYIGAGDGGFIGDPDNRAQNLGEFLGKIHRIDVDNGDPYGIPPDNPFVDVPGVLPEIWAYGVRNPWRFSFDRLTGDMYMGDVGQWTWEEVNFQPADSPGGENYGWRRMEGTHCFDPAVNCEQPGLTMPILEYQHVGGDCAVTGGFVYRGARFPRFQGLYFYADWCTGKIWGARQVGSEWVNTQMLDSSLNPTTFGEDEAGEVYVGDDGSGRIYALIDPRPFCDVAMSQPAYTGGDLVTSSSRRLVNLGTADRPVRYQMFIVGPGGGALVLIDTTFQLPAGTENDPGSLPLFTVGVGTPTGNYSLNCRLSNPATGTTLSRDQAVFTVE